MRSVKDLIKVGDAVKMSEELKETTIRAGFKFHILAFGNCVGIVESYPSNIISECNVSWLPSKLTYRYNKNKLIRLND
jgi:hypothetical protein